MDLFWERGYEATSIADLTEKLEIGAPSLYAAFSCKEALFLEAVELYNDTDGAITDRAVQSAPTARFAVESMLRENVEAYSTGSRPTGCMFVVAALVGAPGSTVVRERLARYRADGQTLLAKRFEDAVRAGELPSTTDVEGLAAYYTTVLQGLSIQARSGASRQMMESVVDHAMTTWTALLPGRTDCTCNRLLAEGYQ